MDNDGNLVVDPQKMRSMDKALLLVLILLRTPEDQRHHAAKCTLSDFTTHKDRLLVHKDVAPNERPHPAAVNYDEFLEMMVGWEQLPNPALVAEGGAATQTSWRAIAEMLRERDISLDDIDQSLYHELTTLAGEVLQHRLDELKDLALAGILRERRKKLLAGLAAASMRPQNTFHYIQPKEQDRRVLYAMRYSHSHPRGKLFDPAEERHRDVQVAERQENSHTRPTIHEGIQTLKEKKRTWAKSKCGKVTKYTCIILVIVGILAVILLACYFRMGQSRKPSARE
ncbi:hypothetical protein BU26DRAFT_558327 [Trematosphaeria pertusa]|uniref:Uncharacterized protein n=1 Tax=Trematosphaeria pertusa TaxID=390896 RepID=A0A6A6J5Y5_9PLEO|nr:uncharacterized protein BU26DRAFT_558327 [Trematosphaeria pertusa]KAF2256893.1 hypothetical protein BU26DRAFT_558327 [Trematosphaeria pertusa]